LFWAPDYWLDGPEIRIAYRGDIGKRRESSVGSIRFAAAAGKRIEPTLHRCLHHCAPWRQELLTALNTMLHGGERWVSGYRSPYYPFLRSLLLDFQDGY
jgi:hypothetical protein